MSSKIAQPADPRGRGRIAVIKVRASVGRPAGRAHRQQGRGRHRLALPDDGRRMRPGAMTGTEDTSLEDICAKTITETVSDAVDRAASCQSTRRYGKAARPGCSWTRPRVLTC
jgi:hypothetical protein